MGIVDMFSWFLFTFYFIDVIFFQFLLFSYIFLRKSNFSIMVLIWFLEIPRHSKNISKFNYV